MAQRPTLERDGNTTRLVFRDVDDDVSVDKPKQERQTAAKRRPGRPRKA